MTDTFNPSRVPNFEIQKKVAIRNLDAKFGDGYSQRAGDGLNTAISTYTVTWSVLTGAEAQEIEDFFEAENAVSSFNYTIPFEDAAKKFICKEWTRTKQAFDRNTIVATFEQVFDLG